VNRWDVYIASSWSQRTRVRALAVALRERGYRVYDFTDPACRGAPEIPPEQFPEQFDPAKHVYGDYLKSVPQWGLAVSGNRSALGSVRAVALLLPCGMDSHADWAYAVGRGAYSCVVGHPPAGQRTPSHLWANSFLTEDGEVAAWCDSVLR